jgi:hypothetical protein
MLRTQLAALAAISLAVSGCGGSSKTGPLTRAELIAKADAICARFHTELHAHGSKTPQELARNVPLLASYEQTAGAELRKLTAPASMANDWKQIVDSVQTLANDTAKVAPYAKENKLQAAQSLISEGQQVQQQALAMAKRDGFNQCAQAS